MNLSLFVALLSILLGPMIDEGKATRYSPGVMDQVVMNRVRWGQLDLSQPHVGYVAVADCKYLNQLVVLDMPGYGFIGPVLVADCGAAHDQEYLDSIDFAVDLSWELAQQAQVMNMPRCGVKVYLWQPQWWE